MSLVNWTEAGDDQVREFVKILSSKSEYECARSMEEKRESRGGAGYLCLCEGFQVCNSYLRFDPLLIVECES